MSQSAPRLQLPDFLKRALAAGHPWVYRDHVPRGFRATTGTWIELHAGNWQGFALWDADSPIALRVFSQGRVPDAAWIRGRIDAAHRLREPLRAQGTTAYRWLNGEGDGLPGITVDRYASQLVMMTYSAAVEPLVPWVVEALRATPGVEGISRRVKSAGESGRLDPVWGEPPPAELVVEENGMRLQADLAAGQKTGLFLDHRDNRAMVRRIAGGRSVLNLFSYTGAFSVGALLGGATHVTSVDAAGPAVAAIGRNLELNGIDPARHEGVAADVFAFLERTIAQARRFDLVICDPPSFAHSKDQLDQALKAYARVNAMALRTVAPEGLLASASCTAQVGPEAFRDMLADAGRQAKRRLQIIHDAGQALDHPVFAGHREGRYLKFVVARALPVA